MRRGGTKLPATPATIPDLTPVEMVGERNKTAGVATTLTINLRDGA